jgi:hypothetical protein
MCESENLGPVGLAKRSFKNARQASRPLSTRESGRIQTTSGAKQATMASAFTVS